MSKVLRLFHFLPYPARVLVASVQGYRLRWWRYGALTDRMVEEAHDRETWSAEAWTTWQRENLESLLNRAATRVPYYRDQWQLRRRSGDDASWNYLENWPILKKEALRANNALFVADGCNRNQMYCDHTSGTSGTPLKMWQSRDTVQKWYALFEARWRGWHGLSRNDRWAILGGQLVVPYSQTRPPFWVWNAGLNQLYLSSYHLNRVNAHHYFEAIKRHEVVYLWGYASALSTLAQLAIDLGVSAPGVRQVISNAEPLYDHQRQIISQTFGCPVADTYGMSEAVCAASECNAGQMHLWPEVGITEVLDDINDRPVPDGTAGKFVSTGLTNSDMPLVRYEIGDRGAIAAGGSPCSCGRTLPILSAIEGRNDDMILTKDGRKIGRLDPIFKADFHIREAQIIQEDIDSFRIKYVPADGCVQSELEEMKARLCERVGDVNVVMEKVESVPRTASGKFRAVISRLNQ